MGPEVKVVDFSDRRAIAVILAPVSGKVRLAMKEGSAGQIMVFREMLDDVRRE